MAAQEDRDEDARWDAIADDQEERRRLDAEHDGEEDDEPPYSEPLSIYPFVMRTRRW